MTRKYLFYKPHPALGSVVNNILVFHATNELQTKVMFPFPPLPEHCILFYPFDRPFVEDVNTKQLYQLYACTIAGQHTERTVLSLGQNHLIIKIGFQPGAMQRLLGVPMHKMIPCISYDGEDVFGQNVKHTTDAFANAASYEMMKEIADNFMLELVSKVKKPNTIDFVIPQILKHGGMIKIDALVKAAYMSNRQFERAFKDRMGVSPKFYSRLVRFSKAWILKEDHPKLTWTRVAYSCNYFDQMHLIRDFKEFADYNPSEISEAFKKQPFMLKNGIFH